MCDDFGILFVSGDRKAGEGLERYSKLIFVTIYFKILFVFYYKGGKL